MHLVTEPRRAVDLTTTPIHLGLGSRALPVEGFEWDAGVLEAYVAAVSGDGAEGRLVMIFQGDGSGTHWERHPAGDEVVVCLSGRMTVTRELGDEHDPVELVAGQSVVNPRGVWHVVDMHQPGQLLTITPGTGTEHRPRHPGGPSPADDHRRAGPTVTRRRMA